MRKGIGRCGEQQQEEVEKKAKKNRAAGRTRGIERPASSNCDTVHHPAKHPFGPPRTPSNFEFRVPFGSHYPPDTLYSHCVHNRYFSHCLRLSFVMNPVLKIKDRANVGVRKICKDLPDVSLLYALPSMRQFISTT